MATDKDNAAALEKKVASLEKEVKALKAQLAKKQAGGADPRVDKLIKALRLFYTDGLPKAEARANRKKAYELLK